MSRKQPVRSSQIVTQYGVGSMITGRDGVSLIVAGLDSWQPADISTNTGRGRIVADPLFDEEEFVIREPRLEKRLRVEGFRSPPQFREARRGVIVPNTNLTVPVLRFPQSHTCSLCGLMETFPLTQTGKVFCRACREKDRFQALAQMPFVAICDRGHMQDFPWREWVHRQHNPICTGNLHYVRSGGGTLAAQKIKCGCGVDRSLLNIDKANFSDTYLSFNLSKSDGLYFCRGHKPWLGETVDVGCESYLRGNLRNAGNVWFSQTVSAICLPEEQSQLMSGLHEFLAKTEVATKIRSMEAIGEKNIAQLLKIFYGDFLNSFNNAQIEEALNDIVARNQSATSPGRFTMASSSTSASASTQSGLIKVTGEITETEFRHTEFKVLREEQDNDLLLARQININQDSSILSTNFSRLVQVHRLRETRAFTGFSRIFSDNAPALEERKAMLRRNVPIHKQADSTDGDEFGNIQQPTAWLPATTVFGEGIYLELKGERLQVWENSFGDLLRRHLAPLEVNGSKMRRNVSNTGNKAETTEDNGVNEKISPKFMLVHTLAHILINELTFDSGYSAAALRERIYVSENKATPMAGLLIYTADGDSAGTMGGLVRLGTPENLEKLLKRVLRNARWCSSDPGCSEIGTSRGQGPENRNLAACHACALLPETSCEEFNRYLDRSLLVNITETPSVGFFDFV